MKIAHLADIHLSEMTGPVIDGENARMMDTIRCMNYAAEKLREEQPDIVLIAGDLFHKSKLWADEMLKEITIASNWLRTLSDIAPTVLMFGTANHDNMKAFLNINAMQIPYLTVVTEPNLLTVNTKSGDIQIAAIPGMDKGHLRTLYPGMDMQDENKAISEALGNVVLGLSNDINKEIPSVLMAHYTVTGCQLENGESVFLNSDVVLPTAALQASNYDLVCLGHIHRAQSVLNCGRPTYYSGPLNGITFNEEGQDKGFWIHEFNDSMQLNSRFIKTPSREFLTLEMDDFEVNQFIKEGLSWFYKKDSDGSTYFPPAKDKIVRVIYSCTDETNKRFNKKALEQKLYDTGAFYVSEIRPSKILTTTDKKALNENNSVMANLKEWFKNNDIGTNEAIEAIELAKPFIETIEATLPTGKLSGIFEPVSLEVKNYRSYRNESFDFTKVSFATVNGPNGIGKSSFFMDAIVDCLYEEPREGELTGWISNNEDARSGAITFEFLMGSDKWKVVRTRAKSGKTTLSLQKWNKDKWENHSANKKDDTQIKIVNLLGMDAMTFKSCALIMQDQYGLFLEADKTDRMQVLSNILGLSMYDKLHELIKDNLRDYNRNVQKLKDRINILDDKLKNKSFVEGELKKYQDEKNEVQNKIEEAESKIKQLEEQLKTFNILDVKIKAITDKLINFDNSIKSKKNEISDLSRKNSEAKQIVSQEDIITGKVAEYENIKQKLTVLDSDKTILQDSKNELKKVENDISEMKEKDSLNEAAINDLNLKLESKSELERKIADIPELEKKLQEFENKKVEFEKASQNERDSRQKVLNAEKEFENKSEGIKHDIENLKGRAKLIENSDCPIDNPSCNFLKDALEAKNKIPELEGKLESLDHSVIERLQKQYDLAQRTLEESQYNSEGLENLKRMIEIKKSYKIKLAGLSGKEDLLKNYISQRENYIIETEKLETKEAALNIKIKSLNSELGVINNLEDKLKSLSIYLTLKDKLIEAKQTLETTNKRIKTLTGEIQDINKQIIQEETERDKLADERIKLQNVNPLLERTKNYLTSYRTDMSKLDTNIGQYSSGVETMMEYETERDEKTESLKKQAKITTQLNTLVQAFSIDGIPFQIVRSVVAELSAKSNEILSQMTGGKMSIEFKMDKVLKNKKEINALEIWINDYQRGTMPYLSRSGGQKVKAALSVAFALADLKANRAGIQLGMMFIDEPPFLDSEGTQAYADALELMHDHYREMKVIAISHDPTMKARFPQSIDVMDTEEGSKISFNG